jgi:nitrite reductase/ring-hydroxylating ferredoxin subunit
MSSENARQDCSGCAGDPAAVASSHAAAEDGIARRTFLIQSGILAAMAALAACGGASATAPDVPAGSTVDISAHSSLASVGGVAIVSLGGAPVAIVRTSSTAFLALSLVCPHEGGIVGQSGSRFVCPVHGATFDIDGNWIGGQRTSSLHQYATSYNATTNVLTVG